MAHAAKIAFFIVLVSVIALFFAAACGPAAPRADAATEKDLETGNVGLTYTQALVTYAAGDVSVATPGASAGIPVAAGDFVTAAQTLSTGADSFCELQLGRQAVIRIEADTVLRLAELALAPGAARTGLEVTAGTLLCKVEKLGAGERFEVKTKTAVCGVRGTEFDVTVAPDDNTSLAVKEGRVALLPAALDADRLAAEASGADPAVAEALRGLADTAAEVVAAGEESEITAATAAQAEDRVRAFRGELKAYTKTLKLSPPEIKAMQARVLRLNNELQGKAKALRRMSPERKEQLQRLNELRFRRFRMIPNQFSAEDQPLPSNQNETPRPSVNTGERTAAETGRSEALVRIEVTVEPRAAAIFLNGRPAARGRLTGLFSEGEDLSFAFRLPGYAPQDLALTVGAQGRKTYSIKLQRESAVSTESDGINPRDTSLPSTAGPGERGPDRSIVYREQPTTVPFTGNLAVVGNRLIAVDRNGTVFCLDVRGKTVWSKPSSNNPNAAGLLAADGKIYFAGTREIVVLSAADGKEVERFPADKVSGDVYNRRFVSGAGLVAQPTDRGVDVFEPSGNGAPRSVDLPAGMTLSLFLSAQTLFMADKNGTIRAFDLDTGRPAPQAIRTVVRDPLARAVWGSPARLYLAGSDRLACVDPEKRRLLWGKPIPGNGIKTGDLEVSDVGIYVFSAGRLIAFSHEGAPLFPPLAGLSATPLAVKQSLAFGRDDGSFVIADARTGRPLKRLPLGSNKITVRPVVLGDYLAVATEAGEIIVIDPAAMQPVEAQPPASRNRPLGRNK